MPQDGCSLSFSVPCKWPTGALDVPSSPFEDYTTQPPDGLGNLVEGPSSSGIDVSLCPERDYTAACKWQLGNPFLGPAFSDVSQDIGYAAVDHGEDFVLDEFLDFPDESSPMNTSSSESHYFENDGADASSCSEPAFAYLSPDTDNSGWQDDVTLSSISASSTPLSFSAKQSPDHSSKSKQRAVPIPRAAPLLKCQKCPALFVEERKLE